MVKFHRRKKAVVIPKEDINFVPQQHLDKVNQPIVIHPDKPPVDFVPPKANTRLTAEQEWTQTLFSILGSLPDLLATFSDANAVKGPLVQRKPLDCFSTTASQSANSEPKASSEKFICLVRTLKRLLSEDFYLEDDTAEIPLQDFVSLIRICLHKETKKGLPPTEYLPRLHIVGLELIAPVTAIAQSNLIPYISTLTSEILLELQWLSLRLSSNQQSYKPCRTYAIIALTKLLETYGLHCCLRERQMYDFICEQAKPLMNPFPKAYGSMVDLVINGDNGGGGGGGKRRKRRGGSGRETNPLVDSTVKFVTDGVERSPEEINRLNQLRQIEIQYNRHAARPLLHLLHVFILKLGPRMDGSVLGGCQKLVCDLMLQSCAGGYLSLFPDLRLSVLKSLRSLCFLQNATVPQPIMIAKHMFSTQLRQQSVGGSRVITNMEVTRFCQETLTILSALVRPGIALMTPDYVAPETLRLPSNSDKSRAHGDYSSTGIFKPFSIKKSTANNGTNGNENGGVNNPISLAKNSNFLDSSQSGGEDLVIDEAESQSTRTGTNNDIGEMEVDDDASNSPSLSSTVSKKSTPTVTRLSNVEKQPLTPPSQILFSFAEKDVGKSNSVQRTSGEKGTGYTENGGQTKKRLKAPDTPSSETDLDDDEDEDGEEEEEEEEEEAGDDADSPSNASKPSTKLNALFRQLDKEQKAAVVQATNPKNPSEENTLAEKDDDVEDAEDGGSRPSTESSSSPSKSLNETVETLLTKCSKLEAEYGGAQDMNAESSSGQQDIETLFSGF